MSFSCNILTCLCHEEDGRAAMKLAENAYESLSPEEKRNLASDLYGYGETELAETPEFIQRKLDELEMEMGLLATESRKYHTKAIADEQRRLHRDGGEKYIGSVNFRLQFLRAELFDAGLAARRLIEYFHHKFELFGEEKLARRIQQADLNENEKEALVSGVVTHTGAIDLAFRPVLIIRRENMFRFSLTCIKRVFFYVFQKAVEENETAQKTGVVLLLYHMFMPFRKPTLFRSYHPALRMLKHGLPVRYAAIHIFYCDLREHFLLNLALVMLKKNERARLLTHYKHSHEECMCTAMTFCINPDQLPLTGNGDFRYEVIRKYWEKQREVEESNIYESKGHSSCS